ncbi:MAG: hypothetical protein C0410_14175 [Anaerolinea sp.]|nr:hypothetical protein [Anaerolinea sp.]
MKISALVVTFNEEKRLRECLQSVSFCDQIVVVDLGSTDNSVKIAKEFATDFIIHKLVPVVEEIWPEIFPSLKYDWILRVDPDEIFPEDIIGKVGGIILSDNTNVGILTIPYQYYFLGKPLNYTIWGGVRNLPKIINRQRINLHMRVHNGFSLKVGFETLDIASKEQSAVKHYWADSYKQLFAKHNRYIKNEGKSRYERAERFSLFLCIKEPIRAIRYSLFFRDGWRDGCVGIFLSFFFGWYVFMSLLSLGIYQWRANTGEKR